MQFLRIFDTGGIKKLVKGDFSKNKKPLNLSSILLPTFGDILWLVTFFLVLIRGRHMINADGDLALHLNLGRYILQFRKIPLKDVFSHTMTGQRVTQHEWLTTVIFSLAERYFGLTGVIIICALVISTAFWFLFKHSRKATETIISPFLTVFLSMIISMTHWLARPHLITFLLLTLWMMTLTQLRSGKTSRWWAMPLIMLAWVNLHGGFIIGFITWFIYGMGVLWDVLWQRLPKAEGLPHHFWHYYLLGGISAFISSLLNPSGIKLWEKIIAHVGNRYLADFTQEFRSPNFHWTSLWPALFFIALLIILLGVSKKKIDSGLLFNAAGWLVMGLYSGRNIPLFAIVTAPLIALSADEFLLEASHQFNFIEKIKELDARIQNIEKQLIGLFWPFLGIIAAIAALFLGFRFDYQKLGYAFDPGAFPIEAVNWIENNPQKGDMFNLYQWGGYIEYRLWPEERVFIDSKSDFYGEQFVRQYETVINGDEGWELIIEEYNVEWALIPPDLSIAHALQRDLGWKVVYEDETAAILRKD